MAYYVVGNHSTCTLPSVVTLKQTNHIGTIFCLNCKNLERVTVVSTACPVCNA